MLLNINKYVPKLDCHTIYEIENMVDDEDKATIWSADGQFFVPDRVLYDQVYVHNHSLTRAFIEEFPRVLVEGPIIQDTLNIGGNVCLYLNPPHILRHKCSIMLNHDAI
jgi:hypothetical protein